MRLYMLYYSVCYIAVYMIYYKVYIVYIIYVIRIVYRYVIDGKKVIQLNAADEKVRGLD